MKQIKLDQATLNKWAEMTDENNHVEVRIEIAKYFHLDKIQDGFFRRMDFVDAFETEADLIGRTHHRNLPMSCITTRAMFSEIARQYGEDIAEKVWECL